MAEDIKPLDGKTTFDDKVVFEAQRLSYDAARVIAEKIAKRISERTKGHSVVIAGTQFLVDLSNLAATAEVLVELEHDYDSFVRPGHGHPILITRGGLTTDFHTALVAPFPVLGAVTAGVQGALTLVSLFRQDVDYKGVPVSIDTVAFEIELAARLRMHKAREVIVPDLVVFKRPSSAPGSLKVLLERVKAARAAAASVIELNALDLEAGSRKLETRERHGMKEEHYSVESRSDAPASPAKPAADPKPDPVAKALGPLDMRFNDLQSQLAKADASGSGLTTLARLLRVESIMARDPTIVHARVVLAGGNNRVQHSLWSSIFSGDGLSSSGGAVVSWAILSAHGTVEDGGALSHSMSAASPKPPETPPSFS